MIESEIKEFDGVPEFYDWLIEQDVGTTKIFTIKAEVCRINKMREGNPMQCTRCGWYGVTVMKNRYKYCVRWYCSKCGKWIA